MAIVNVIKWVFDVGCIERYWDSTQSGIFMATRVLKRDENLRCPGDSLTEWMVQVLASYRSLAQYPKEKVISMRLQYMNKPILQSLELSLGFSAPCLVRTWRGLKWWSIRLQLVRKLERRDYQRCVISESKIARSRKWNWEWFRYLFSFWLYLTGLGLIDFFYHTLHNN